MPPPVAGGLLERQLARADAARRRASSTCTPRPSHPGSQSFSALHRHPPTTQADTALSRPVLAAPPRPSRARQFARADAARRRASPPDSPRPIARGCWPFDPSAQHPLTPPPTAVTTRRVLVRCLAASRIPLYGHAAAPPSLARHAGPAVPHDRFPQSLNTTAQSSLRPLAPAGASGFAPRPVAHRSEDGPSKGSNNRKKNPVPEEESR